MNYLVYFPPGYDDPELDSKKWPVVFTLHGLLETGNNLRILPKYGLARQVEQGRDYPFIAISPQTPDMRWQPRRAIDFIEYCAARYRIDPERIYLTGFSIGGRAVWSMAAERPDLFAAIAPVGGWGTDQEARAAAAVPAWVFHGRKDRIIPLSSGEQMSLLHEKAGGESKLTIYEDGGHEIWDQIYPEEFLYDWFMSHSLSNRNIQRLTQEEL